MDQQQEQQVRESILRYLPHLQDPSAEISLTPLPSFANFVYKAAVKQNGLRKTYLYKEFREYLFEFSSKTVENEVVTILSKSRLCPQILYSDEARRIEEFVPAEIPTATNVTQSDLLYIVKGLASMNELLHDYVAAADARSLNKRRVEEMFPIFEQVAQECKSLHPDAYSNCQSQIENVLNPQIRAHLRQMVPTEFVASHNDMHFHNILVPHDQAEHPRLYIIDYEFFSLNYRGFELGNFFNEFATDYESFEIRLELEMPQSTQDKLIKAYYQTLGQSIEFSLARREVAVGRMLSHLFWLFIGVKQIRDPNIPLNMDYYVQRRYEEFMKWYKELSEKEEG